MSVIMTLLRSAAGDSITQKWVEHNKKFSEHLDKLKEEGTVLEWHSKRYGDCVTECFFVLLSKRKDLCTVWFSIGEECGLSFEDIVCIGDYGYVYTDTDSRLLKNHEEAIDRGEVC